VMVLAATPPGRLPEVAATPEPSVDSGVD